MLALYREVEELVRIGAYARGSDPETDTAIDMAPRIESMLRQSVDEVCEFERTKTDFVRLAMESGERYRTNREQAGLPAQEGGR